MVQVLTLAALLLTGYARAEFGADVKGLVERIKSRQYFGEEESLKGTFKEARPHLPRLAVELTDRRKREFAHAIFLAGPPTEDQREAFEKLLEHPDPAVRLNASGALSANDRKWNKPSVPAVMKAAHKAQGEERITHVQRLYFMESDRELLWSFVRGLIYKTPEGERHLAARSMCIAVHTTDEETLDLIVDGLSKVKPEDRELYQRSIESLRRDVDSPLRARERRKPPEPRRRSAASNTRKPDRQMARWEAQIEAAREQKRALAELAAQAERRRLVKADEQAREMAFAHCRPGQGLEPDTVVLLSCLREDRGSAVGLLYALGSLGPKAKSGVPDFVERLDHESAAYRSAAAYALGRMGSAATPARNKLKRLRRDPHPSVRIHAEAALAALEQTAPVRSWWKLW